MLEQYFQNNEAFDSISQQSYESTVPSEFVELQVKRYRDNLANDSATHQVADKTQVVNIHVDAVNFYGENEGRDFVNKDYSHK